MNELIWTIFLVIVLFLNSKRPDFIFFGLFIRIGLAILHHVLHYNLPDSGDGFGFLREINNFHSGTNPLFSQGISFISSIWFYPSVIAAAAKTMSLNPYYLAISLNIFAGMLIQKHVIKYLHSFRACENNRNVALLSLLFSTTLAVYSANLLREVYIMYFLVRATLKVLSIDDKTNLDYIYVILYILGAATLHIGVIILLPIYSYVFVKSGILKKWQLVASSVVLLLILINTKIGFNKIEGVYNFIEGNTSSLSFRTAYDDRLDSRGDVYYFSGLMKSGRDQLVLALPKLFEYLLRPNVIDLRGNYSFFKALETNLFFLLYFITILSFKKFRVHQKTVLAGITAVLMIYGSYSGDMNQGHRHKFKVFPLLILLYGSRKEESTGVYSSGLN